MATCYAHIIKTLVTFSTKAAIKMVASLYMVFFSLLLLFGASEENEENKAKVICHFKRFANTDILEMPGPLKLSKILFKKCKMQVRVVSDLEKISRNDLISFASQKNDNKESLWQFLMLKKEIFLLFFDPFLACVTTFLYLCIIAC